MALANTGTPASENANGESLKWHERLRMVHVMGIMVILLSATMISYMLYIAHCSFSATADGDKQFDRAKELLNIMLPIVSTWMGTILAFYFSKDNFEAAQKNVNALVKKVTNTFEKLEGLKARDVMAQTDTMGLLKVKDEDDFKSRRLLDIIDEMEKSQSERMPILQQGTLKYIFLIYRQTIERFITEYNAGRVKLNSGQTVATKDLTVKDLFESDYKIIKEILALKDRDYFVSEDISLEEVRQMMLDNTICQDVFVTKTGKKEEPVLGWITNNILVERADVFKKAGPRF